MSEEQAKPEPETTSEQLAEIEGQAESVWVCEGWWRTRRGEVKYIRAGGSQRDTHYSWPWTDGLMCFQDNGFYQASKPCDDDLVEYLGLIKPEPQPEPQLQPQPQPQPLPATEPEPETTTKQLADTSGRDIVQCLVLQIADLIQREEAEIERQPEPQPSPQQYTPPEGWRVLAVGEVLQFGDMWVWGSHEHMQQTVHAGSVVPKNKCYIRPIELQPQPEQQEQPESDAELRIRLLKQCNDNQAETIKRLMAEARDLNMEIGGLQRQLSQRDDRIRDLETLHAAAAQAVVDAGKQNDALRLQVQNRQQEYERQKGRIEFLETLNAGNGAAIDSYRLQVAKLQGLVDTAHQQLEAAATERDELRAAIDTADEVLDKKSAQIRDLRIELDAAQQVPQPVSDEERERIWDEATEAAGRQVIQWLRPLTRAFNRHPDALFYRMMALTIQVLPDVLPELLGYAGEDESLDSDEDGE